MIYFVATSHCLPTTKKLFKTKDKFDCYFYDLMEKYHKKLPKDELSNSITVIKINETLCPEYESLFLEENKKRMASPPQAQEIEENEEKELMKIIDQYDLFGTL